MVYDHWETCGKCHSRSCECPGRNQMRITSPQVEKDHYLRFFSQNTNPETLQVLIDISAERFHQKEKWGQQDLPSFCQVLLNRVGECTPQRMAEEYEIPGEHRAKFLCDSKADRKELTFADILIEEVAEVVATCMDEDESHTRLELVQCAGVIIQWIEAIDRRQKSE